jgi:hypothetical protein
VFAGIILGGIPIVAATWAGLAGLLGVLPGTMGITLGRNPDGVVRDLAQRTRPVLERPSLLLGIAVAEAALVALWLTGTLSGWVAGAAGFLLPFIGARLAELGAAEATAPDPLDDVELLGLDGRASAVDLRRLDLALALDEVPA